MKSPIVKIRKHTGTLYAVSTDVAFYFEREHKNVLKAIDTCLSEQPSLAADFSAAKYHSRGKSYNCFEMTRRGFCYLILGFTGKRANKFKLIHYIDQFDRMEQFIRDSLESKSGSLDMCRLLQETRAAIGKETTAIHYINEHNLIYRVAFGKSAKQLREELGVPEGNSITEFLSDRGLKEVSDLRHYDAQLMTMGNDYKAREQQLVRLHECKLKLSPPV